MVEYPALDNDFRFFGPIPGMTDTGSVKFTTGEERESISDLRMVLLTHGHADPWRRKKETSMIG
jgi:hypothetical protein